MKQTSLLFGVHCHQPVDNFDEVVLDAIAKSYAPFFKTLVKFEGFKLSVHFSGWLLEFIQRADKELFDVLKVLSERKQIEFFSGGFYEPILSSIPSKDRIAQIEMLNSYIKKHFNQTPKGLWLTERVWDSSLICDLAKCNIEYVVVDDYHFLSTGFHENTLNGYYITEDNQASIKLFPINKNLRYILPFKAVDSVVSYISSLKDSLGGAGVIFDDGEKFGVWPKTYEWVYENGWLEKFFQNILESDDIKSELFYEYIANNKALGVAYLPTTSYHEMGEWSLHSYDGVYMEKIKKALKKFENVDKFVKGSIWKNFFIKYKESNHIHKRVLELSKKATKSKTYLDSLYKAQTNDVLWHGVFGGLYLPNLRDNAYKFIIECENELYKSDTLDIADNNFDMYEEVKFINKNYIALFDSRDGAGLVELDLRDAKFNLLNTLSRYQEAYHDKIENPEVYLDEDEIEDREAEDEIDTIHSIDVEKLSQYKNLLKIDWHRKASFIDHISDSYLGLDSFEANNYKEYGDFANQPFEVMANSKKQVTFIRDGGTYIENNYRVDTKLKKSFKFSDNSIEFMVEIENFFPRWFTYLMELNFHFAGEIRVNGDLLIDKLALNSDNLELFDNYTKKIINIKFENPIDIYIFKVNTVSQSEKGFDLTTQGISIGFRIDFSKKMNLNGVLEIKSI